MSPQSFELSQFSFFHGLLPQELDALAGCAERVGYEPRQYLFQQRGRADSFYAIAAGLGAVEIFTSQCRRVRVQTLHSDEMLGWSWLFPPYIWHFDALALTRVEALRFEARQVRQLIASDHEFGYQLQLRFMPLIIKRLQATRMQMAELYGDQPGPDPDPETRG